MCSAAHFKVLLLGLCFCGGNPLGAVVLAGDIGDDANGVGDSATCLEWSRRADGTPLRWSVHMADSVLRRHPDLKLYPDKNGQTKIKWQYDQAFLGMSIDLLGQHGLSGNDTKDEAYIQYMEEFMDYFVQSDGSIKKYDREKYNLDHVNPAKNLITMHLRTHRRRRRRRYRRAINNIVKQLKKQPRTESGGYWHKLRYPDQMWLDGIYMASPFMAQYAKEYNEPEWYDEAVFQINLIYQQTRDQKTGLLYHAWDESRKEKWSDPDTGLSENFWGRGSGWFLMALVDVLDYLPSDHDGRDQLLNILKDTSNALLAVRDPETGLWYQVLDKGDEEGNYLEMSASSMFIYAFAKASRLGYLNLRSAALNSFESLVKRFISVDEEDLLTLTNICGSAGLGGDPYRDGSLEYYTGEQLNDNDVKGVAPFIIAAMELECAVATTSIEDRRKSESGLD